MKSEVAPLYTEIPVMSGREYKFVRRNAGITLNTIAKVCKKLSRSTIYYWETQSIVKPFQIEILMKLISPAEFETGRIAFLEYKSPKRRKKRRKIFRPCK